ncbi:multidrug/biocide efflux PACE transporter [Pigmentiphaga sp. NML080357]|uniref:multidrug/biocide efflux PACE transporter n=1 Tax=Pigmentiphaga sp. NML080357 TaxID=2008675 RepID=UPI001E4A0011|nr:multidrug/biocide efflux PACE transporter [Pigmentiphaga sp. NML080357]
MVPKKTLGERLAHALLFEIIAVALCAPALAWIMGKPLLHMGALTAAISLVAMLWNMVYNAGFERVERRLGWVRDTRVRVGHALGFEGGLIVIVVPLAAWWLGISLWEALVLDIGLLLFFLPYTYLYNLVYDRARDHWAGTNGQTC